MNQLLLHLIGDYITQSHWMATNKTKYWWPALCHSILYSLPFLLITTINAVFVIWITHLLIDRFRLVRFLIFIKNYLGYPFPIWKRCSNTGYDLDVPVWLSVWLMIIADNILHLSINYMCIRYL